MSPKNADCSPNMFDGRLRSRANIQVSGNTWPDEIFAPF